MSKVSTFEQILNHIHENGGGGHLSVRQIVIFLELYKEPQTVRGLAQKLKVPAPSITRTMDKLVDYQWAVRKDDPEDGRSILMDLTDFGRDFVDRFFGINNEK